MTAHRTTDACEREPIRTPGCIQPHGVLLCCGADGVVLAASANRRMVGPLSEEIIGRRISDLLPTWSGAGCATLPPGPGLPHGACVQVHDQADTRFVEIEPLTGNDQVSLAQLTAIGQALADMNGATTLEALSDCAAAAIRACTGMERVLVYRFDGDGNGEVVAESKVADWDESFVGFHFPAADIPAQARAMYKVSPSRFVPERDYAAVAVEPGLDPRTGVPFDLAPCQLRSVSPVHRQYQQNLGVDGSMSLSILSDGRLWGLVVGHHRGRWRVPMPARRMAMAMTTALSMRLAAAETAEERDARARHVVLHAKLLEQIAGADDFVSPLLHGEVKLTDIFFASSGAAVVYREGSGSSERLEVRTVGVAPDAEAVVRLAGICRQRMVEGVFATDRTAEIMPEFAKFADIASGVLAIAVGEDGRHIIMWFRPEMARTVVWGGASPATVERRKQAGDYLPRRSFARWTEELRGHSRPWPTWKTDIALSLRTALNDVILRQMRTIRNLNARLEESDRAKSRFLAHMSHELRTPLNAVLGFSEAIEMGMYGQVSARQREGLGAIRAAGAHLLNMVNDILDLSKIEAGRLELHASTFDLNALAERISVLLSGMARDSHLALRTRLAEALPGLTADERLVKQMLLNLLSNAIKFTPPGGTVTIVTERRADGGLTLAVADTGVGIAPADFARVLEPFRQADNDMQLAHKGTGLGLPIVKSLIEMHGGTLELDSSVGTGTWVRLLFPPPG
ncbi:MAG: ATP-binding protein [Actinomycetota bacterium]